MNNPVLHVTSATHFSTRWETRADGTNYYQSPEWYRYVGEGEGSSYGEDWLRFYHPDDREHLLREWRKSLASKGAHPYDITVRIRRHDASLNQILVGTASWADPSLVKSGLFYPKSAKSAEDRLRHYARSFSLVEVDSSYYAIPSPHAAALWNERTPDNFIFNIKAFRLLTQHPTQPRMLPPHVRQEVSNWPKKNVYYNDLAGELKTEVWHEFTTALEPLRLNGKLGALLFQFPKWFLPSRANFDHLREIRRRLEKYTVAVEFRSALWFDQSHRDKTLAFERDQEFTNVIVDEPQLGASTIPAVWEVTNESLAMVRMHGRNAQTWDKPGLRSASERFNYDYTEQELGELVPDVRQVAKRAESTHVIFNVNHLDQGIRGAQMMSRLLDEQDTTSR